MLRQKLKDAASQGRQKKVKGEEKSATRRSRTTLTAQRLVREWYGEKCILTGNSTVEACHILPDCIERHKKRAENFWGALAVFWPSKDQEQLMQLLEEPDHEKVNLLILDRNSHCLWGNGRFALRPLEAGPDPHEIRLQFLWLNPVRSDTEILNYEDGEDQICDHRNLREKHTRSIIQSGDIVHLTTCNTNEYPLPNRGLLELQWHLNRVVRAAANADFLRLIFRDDEESPEVPAESAGDDEGEYDFAELAGVGHSPYFSLYLINCALERGLIQDSDVPLWKRRLIPWGEDTDVFGEDDEGDEDGKDNKADRTTWQTRTTCNMADKDNKYNEENKADEDNKDWSTEKSSV